MEAPMKKNSVLLRVALPLTVIVVLLLLVQYLYNKKDPHDVIYVTFIFLLAAFFVAHSIVRPGGTHD